MEALGVIHERRFSSLLPLVTRMLGFRTVRGRRCRRRKPVFGRTLVYARPGAISPTCPRGYPPPRKAAAKAPRCLAVQFVYTSPRGLFRPDGAGPAAPKAL